MSRAAARVARAPWDWRVAAVAMGLLMATSTAVFKPIGVSSAYCTSWGMVLESVSPEWARAHPYLKAVGTSLTAEWMLVLGLVLGGLLAARASGSRVREAIPALWAERFGPSRARRFAAAVLGGFLFLFGARLGGGCTSGHVMSGLSQLAVSGLVFAAGLFTSGVLTARLLYRSKQ